MFTDDPNNWTQILTRFDADAQTMGLHTSWSKTCLQNAGYGTTPHPVVIQGHTVDVTDRFTHLGSDISSRGRSTTPEMFRRIGLASSVMGQLTSVWRQSRLSLCSVHQAATVQRPCRFPLTVWRRKLDPNKVRRTEARVFPDVVLTTDSVADAECGSLRSRLAQSRTSVFQESVVSTTDSWNTLVRLFAKRVSNEPDSATKHLQQNPRQTNLNIRSCTSSARSSTST